METVVIWVERGFSYLEMHCFWGKSTDCVIQSSI